MANDEIRQGDVFWIGPGGLGGPEHRYIVVSDHNKDSAVLLFPITSWEDWKDESCIITKQEYPPLRHDSCIDYSYGKTVGMEAMSRELASEQIRRCPSVSSDVLAKVLACAKDSPFLPFWCLDVLSKQGLVD